MTATPKRRWFQYSLREVLIGITVLCLGPGGYLAYVRNSLMRREAAIAALEKLGGSVRYNEERHFVPIWLWPILGEKSADEVVEVDLIGTKVSDADFIHVAGLTELEWLDLNNTKVTGTGFAHLTGLAELKVLYLERTQVTDAGLAHLAGLTKLEQLYLQGSPVTDQGVGALQIKLPNLHIYR